MNHYDQAVKHSRTHRKHRLNNFGFSTGTGPWPSIWADARECPTCSKERPTFFFRRNRCDSCDHDLERKHESLAAEGLHTD